MKEYLLDLEARVKREFLLALKKTLTNNAIYSISSVTSYAAVVQPLENNTAQRPTLERPRPLSFDRQH